MNRKLRLTALAAAFAPALLPGIAAAQNFTAIDLIPGSTSGRFPAYNADAERPTEWYVRGGVVRDSNIFRLSDGANANAILGTSSRSDTITRIGVGIRHEMRIAGRQRVRLAANADRVSFDRFDVLDHTAYGLRGEWLWEFTNDFSGTVGYEKRQRLVDLAQLARPRKDLVVEDHAFLTGAWAVGPSLRVRGGLDGVRARRTDAPSESAGGRVTSYVVGADYVTTLQNAAGIEYRHAKGNFPVEEVVGGTTLVDNDFTEREIAGVLTWTVSPQLRATGRIGRTVRTHVQFPVRDFRGTTGRATIDWTPLQKTGFEVSMYKEPRTIVDIAASYVVVKGISFGPRWAPTEKLVFLVALINENHDYGGDPALGVVPGAQRRDETIRTLRLGGAWEPMRFAKVSLGIDKGRRSSNVALRDYDYTALMANAEVRF